MDLREEIKKVMAEEENAGSIKFLRRQAVNSFTRKILNDARNATDEKSISGTFSFGRIVSSLSSNAAVVGESKKSMFKKSTVWQFSISPDSDEMIRYNAIKEYAEKEDISIDIEICHLHPKNREFEFDLSEFPKITATIEGKHFKDEMNLIRLKDVKLFIKYTVTL